MAHDPRTQLLLNGRKPHLIPFRPSSALVDLQALWEAYTDELDAKHPKLQLNDDEWAEFHNDLRTLSADEGTPYPKHLVAPSVPLVKFTGSTNQSRPAVPLKYLPAYLKIFEHAYEALVGSKPTPVDLNVEGPRSKKLGPAPTDKDLGPIVLQSVKEFFGQTPEPDSARSDASARSGASTLTGHSDHSDRTDDEDVDYIPPAWVRSYVKAPTWKQLEPIINAYETRDVDSLRFAMRVCELFGRFDDARRVAIALDAALASHQ
jgi:hypothetical protein